MARRTRKPESALICLDAAGRVGIVGDIQPGNIKFYPFDADGNTGAAENVEAESLTQAEQSQIPASRRLPDAQAMELGYLDDPAFDPAAPVAPVRTFEPEALPE